MSERTAPAAREARPLPATRVWLVIVSVAEAVWLAFLMWMAWRS